MSTRCDRSRPAAASRPNLRMRSSTWWV